MPVDPPVDGFFVADVVVVGVTVCPVQLIDLPFMIFLNVSTNGVLSRELPIKIIPAPIKTVATNVIMCYTPYAMVVASTERADQLTADYRRLGDVNVRVDRSSPTPPIKV
jgi:hypothetical protein